MHIQKTEYAPYYATYIKTVKGDIIAELRTQQASFPTFIRAIPPQKEDYVYAPGKWSVKEVLGHILDTERIMAYRTLRIARMDETPLPGYEENEYIIHSRYAERSLESLASEFELIRRSNLFLFESFNEEELKRAGTASGNKVSARALLFIMAGHVNHHKHILEERYL